MKYSIRIDFMFILEYEFAKHKGNNAYFSSAAGIHNRIAYETERMRVIPMKYLCINMSTNNTEIFKLITFFFSKKDMLGKAAFQRKRLFSITAEDWIIFSA